MARVIYIVSATQVVVSDNHPEGLLSNKTGYPKTYDSKDYEGNEERAFEVAEAEYRSCESTMLLDTNPSRVMQTITMERSDGRSIYHRSKGAFPVSAPAEEPAEPEQEPEPTEPEPNP